MIASVESGRSLGRQRMICSGWICDGPLFSRELGLGVRIQFPAFANELTRENCADIF